MYNTWINPLQPYQCISRTLTLQLFKPSFQDIRILHLINKRCRGQTGLSVPVVPVHGHFSKKKIGSSQMSNEWEFSCIAQMMQPFPLKYTHRLFPPIKDWRKKKKSLSFVFRFHQLENGCSFSSSMSHLVQWKHSSEREGLEMFFFREPSETKLKREKKNGLLFHLLPWRISPHVKLQSRVKALACVPLVAPAERILPSPSLQTLNQHLVGLERSRQSNWLKADSCVNKALSSYWKLGNLHKVCLREGRRGRLGRKEEGWKEV